MLGETVGSINVSSTGYLITRVENPASGAITRTNLHTTIFHIHLISNGSGASVLTIANGLGGTTEINITGTTSKGIDFDFGIYGITFPVGAYITVDGNIANAAITCKASLF